MTTLVAFIAINALLWLVIAAEAGRHPERPDDGSDQTPTHITRGPLR